MPQHELVQLASALSEKCLGANNPNAYTFEHSRTINVLGTMTSLNVASKTEVGTVTIADVQDDQPYLVESVYRKLDYDEAGLSATVTAQPQIPENTATNSHTNSSAFAIGERLRSNPDTLVSALGRVTQSMADQPMVLYQGSTVADDLHISAVPFRHPLATELNDLVEAFVAEPTRVEIEYPTFYAWGETMTSPFIMRIDRSLVIEGAGDELDKLSLQAEMRNSAFMLDLNGHEPTITAFAKLRPRPAYPQLEGYRVPITSAMAEAADNYPDDVESPYVPLEPELAVSSARKFINAISRIAIDRTDLF